MGTCGFVAAPHGEWTPDTAHLFAGGCYLQGIIGGSAIPATLIPKLIELWRHGRFPFDSLVRTCPFTDIATAWTDTTSDRVVKPMLPMP